jgi:ATP-dependent Lon protease
MMVHACIESDEVFGLVLLRGSGEEETAELIHRVGVVARIVQVERLEDGRMNILTEGESRFQIRRFTQQTPYWKGSVDLFDDEEAGVPDASLHEGVRELYRKVFDLGSRLNADQVSELILPDSAADLSFMISYVLDIPAEAKQELLEMTSAARRLHALVAHLDDTVRKLEQQIAFKELVGKVRGNGDLGNPHSR